MPKAAPYIKYSHTRLAALKAARKDDKTANFTRTKRNLYQYELLFNVDLYVMLEDVALQAGRNLKICDAGCGEAIAMDEILSGGLAKYVKTITGISKHLYENIYKLVQRHGSRFNCFHGDVCDVLRGEKLRFNVIFDLWGPFLYKIQKLEVMQAYYDALEMNGIALIYIGCNNHEFKFSSKVEPKIIDSSKPQLRPRSFREFLLCNYPAHFADISPEVICMRKITVRFPLARSEITYRYAEFCAVNKRAAALSTAKQESTSSGIHKQVVIQIDSNKSKRLRLI